MPRVRKEWLRATPLNTKVGRLARIIVPLGTPFYYGGTCQRKIRSEEGCRILSIDNDWELIRIRTNTYGDWYVALHEIEIRR